MPPLGHVPAVYPWACPNISLSLSFLLYEEKSSHSLTGLWGGILLTELDLHEEMKLTETKESGSRPVILNWRGGCILGDMCQCLEPFLVVTERIMNPKSQQC